MRKFFAAGALALAAMLFVGAFALPPPTLAAAQAVTVAATVQPGTVVVPYGNWLEEALPIVGQIVAYVIMLVLLWALRLVPASLRAFITAERVRQVEQLIARGVDYGLNAVAGAAKGKTLDVHVGSQVVAEAGQYVINHGPDKLIDWMGGPDAIKEKIIARIPLAEQATAAEVLDKAPPLDWAAK